MIFLDMVRLNVSPVQVGVVRGQPAPGMIFLNMVRLNVYPVQVGVRIQHDISQHMVLLSV
jgi:hypothetical protein